MGFIMAAQSIRVVIPDYGRPSTLVRKHLVQS
jgi:hypothetical protein